MTDQMSSQQLNLPHSQQQRLTRSMMQPHRTRGSQQQQQHCRQQVPSKATIQKGRKTSQTAELATR